MSDLQPNPTPEKVWFEKGDKIPNNSNLPTLIYEEIVHSGVTHDFVFDVFRRNHWGGCWKNGVFPYHHFHSSAHEALAVTDGEAKVTLGGPQGRPLS
jgi:uncharacterized protein YjlB